MTQLRHVAETDFAELPVLTGARKGTSLLVLGTGPCGLLVIWELREAG